MIKNAQFEDGFSIRDNASTRDIANDWHWWESRHVLWPNVVKLPEWNPETRSTGKGRVRSGTSAQKQHNTFSICRSGLFQEVPVVKGHWYEFAVWFYVWTSKENNPDESVGSRYHARAAANPWNAGLDHYATVFGREPETEHYNSWYRSVVVFQAFTDYVKVGWEGMAEHPVRHNDLYVDDATFREVFISGDPGEPTDPGNGGEDPPPVEVDIIIGTVEAEAKKLLAAIREIEEHLQGSLDSLLNIEHLENVAFYLKKSGEGQ